MPVVEFIKITGEGGEGFLQAPRVLHMRTYNARLRRNIAKGQMFAFLALLLMAVRWWFLWLLLACLLFVWLEQRRLIHIPLADKYHISTRRELTALERELICETLGAPLL